MEPRIQYAQTTDGVSIAFWTLGEGMPFVHLPIIPNSHIQAEWQLAGCRRWYERLSQYRMLLRYDNRGSGLSDRGISDYSLDALVRDLEAVVDRLGLERFALMGLHRSGPVAIAYEARHPDRVSHLLLWCTWASERDYLQSSTLEAFRRMLGADWEMFIKNVAHEAAGWSESVAMRSIASWLRQSTTPEAYRAVLDAGAEHDVSSLLSQVQCPTLVLHPAQVAVVTVDLARQLAARIPEARLAILEGEAVFPFLSDTEAVLDAIEEFLGEGEEAAKTVAPSGHVTILFTDIEGSTALTQRLGDAKAQEVLRAHNTIVRDALKAHGGSEVKHTGDGIMASFPVASKALECAIAMQRAFAEHNETAAASSSTGSGRAEVIRVRVGMNAGEPVAEDEDLFGTAVQLAARICAHAEPGQILAPIVVRELAAGKGFLFADRGETSLRGFEEPVRLFEVRWREEG